MRAEPSMEEILSSIKRIIAEEDDAPARSRRPSREAAAPTQDDDPHDEEVAPVEPTPVASAPEPEPVEQAASPEPPSDPIVSLRAAQASRGSLEALSRLIVKPEPGGDGTLEGLVREMLRPMLREWLDANLPPLIETMVAREIAKITGRAG